jgi:hypothetical protein
MNDRRRREQFYGWVYENNQWGRASDGARYYSDSPTDLTGPYRTFLLDFLERHPEIRSVVDLACGDYQLSRDTGMVGVHYTGVDIYDKLIEHNRQLYGDGCHVFDVVDLVDDDLPSGDLALVSLVLYLMSHADVLRILPKLRHYRYVLVTDGQADIPAGQRRNIDKPTGKYTPLDLFGNGFYLELPPFNVPVDIVCEYCLPSGEIMRTVLLHHPYAPLAGFPEEYRQC